MSMIYCRGCGKEIHESAETCPSCGAAQNIAITEGRLKLVAAMLVIVVVVVVIGVAVMGVLAVVAVPSSSNLNPSSFNILLYKDYTARAQVMEGISITSSYKTILAEHYAKTHDFTGLSISDLQGATTGKYVDTITIDMASKGTAVLVATFKQTGVRSRIKGKEFRLATEDGGITWACGHRIQNPLLMDTNQIKTINLPVVCK